MSKKHRQFLSFKVLVEIFQKSREQNRGQYDSDMKPPLDEKKLRCLQLQLIPTDSGTAVSLQCCAQTLPFWSICRLQPHYAVDKASFWRTSSCSIFPHDLTLMLLTFFKFWVRSCCHLSLPDHDGDDDERLHTKAQFASSTLLHLSPFLRLVLELFCKKENCHPSLS